MSGTGMPMPILVVGSVIGDRVLGAGQAVEAERQRLDVGGRAHADGEGVLERADPHLRAPVGDVHPRCRTGLDVEDVAHLGGHRLEVGQVGAGLDRDVLDGVRYVGQHGRDGAPG